MQECFKLLKRYKYLLTRQQKRTLKGQILSGDINGFKKGLYKLINRKWLNVRKINRTTRNNKSNAREWR